MGNIILLFLCLLIGMGLRASGRVPDNAHAGLNAFIIHAALPALILIYIHNIAWRPGLFAAVAMPWMLFSGAATLVWFVGDRLRLSASSKGALILTAGLANTSFVGLPMIETFYGAQYQVNGILIDQLGTYLVLSTLGIAVASMCAHDTASARDIVRRIATFPPLIALVVAGLLVNVPYPAWVSDVLTRLSGTLAPLALVSVGLQLRTELWRDRLRPLAFGLTLKLLIAPALLALLYIGLFGANVDSRVTVFESGMGPMIGGSIVATQYGLDPILVTLMVGVGSVLAFLTLPMWWYMLGIM